MILNILDGHLYVKIGTSHRDEIWHLEYLEYVEYFVFHTLSRESWPFPSYSASNLIFIRWYTYKMLAGF